MTTGLENPKADSGSAPTVGPGGTKGEAPNHEERKAALMERVRASRGGGDGVDAGDQDLRDLSLIGEDLSGMDLSGCDFSGAELSRADLKGANLSWCKFKEATLFQSELDGCECMGADFSGANMNECIARRAGFGGAVLDGASVIHARFEGATLSNARLRDSDFTTANLEGARLREADLAHANFARANLRRTDLESSRVAHTVFDGADLRSAHLKGLLGFDKASWIGADIRDVDFTGAYMVRRFIMDQNYLYEFRTRGRNANLAYQVWRVTSDCGRSFTRWALWTALAALVFAGLYGFVDIDYGDHRTFLSPIYYSVVTLTTLGYGDVLPSSSAAQVLAMIEVALGYLALGGLLSIFANKMGRRAD